jgi:YnbE-like lipoprotein
LNDGSERRAGRERLPGERLAYLLASLLALGLAACTPRVEVVAPSEPITINLNIKLDADVRLRVEEKAKQDVETKPIF